MKQRFSKRTRLVSALLTLAMVFTFLPFSAFAATGDIAIDDTSVFTDEGFREYLSIGYHYVDGTKIRIDTDENGILSQDERMAVKNMDVRGYAVYGLKGIEYFTELRELDCTNRPIGSLNLSKNTKLEQLRCKNSGLTQLDLSHNPEIAVLDCSNNNLGNLDLSNNKKLENLNCSYDELNELDVKENTELQELICIGNYLKELDVDVAHKKKLATLKCSSNKLESLIVGENKLLKDLRCDLNQLSQLNLSNLERLETLFCSDNKLTILNVSNSPVLKNLQYTNNQLTSLNLEQSPLLSPSNTSAWGNNNVYTVTLTPERTFNLSTLSGGAFDVSKVITLNGGIVNGNILTVNEGVNKVTYSYRCSDNVTSVFALDVTGTGGIPGGGSTGGGSTGGGSTGGGSTGGGTVPPVTPPSGGGSTGVSGGSDGGAGIAVLAIGGAAVAGLVGYGVYNHVAAQKLRALLPPDVSLPENRAKTALLLWDTAGRPEPAEAPAFADVADPDTAKAAQWCVEQGLMKRRLNGRFGPDGTVPAYRILNAYRQLTGQ